MAWRQVVAKEGVRHPTYRHQFWSIWKGRGLDEAAIEKRWADYCRKDPGARKQYEAWQKLQLKRGNKRGPGKAR